MDIGRGVSLLGRIGEPGEVAEVIAFLTGEGSWWMSGQVMRVNGGMAQGVRRGGRMSWEWLLRCDDRGSCDLHFCIGIFISSHHFQRWIYFFLLSSRIPFCICGGPRVMKCPRKLRMRASHAAKLFSHISYQYPSIQAPSFDVPGAPLLQCQ